MNCLHGSERVYKGTAYKPNMCVRLEKDDGYALGKMLLILVQNVKGT